jgi:hypothetical protein
MAKDKSRAEDIADSVRDRAEEAFERAQAAVEDGLDEAHRYLKRQWRERPVAVAATALGAGVILGLLIGGSRR